MKKYSFLIYHKEYIQFLNNLQELGVLHVIEKESGEIENEELRGNYKLVKELGDVIQFLSTREVKPSLDIAHMDGIEVLHEIQKQQYQKDKVEQDQQVIKKQLDLLKPWGEFEASNLKRLEENGLKVRFFAAPIKKIEESWKSDLNLEIINTIGQQAYFIVVEEKNQPVDVDAEEIKIPEQSISELNTALKKTEEVLGNIEKFFDSAAEKYLTLLNTTKNGIQEKVDFDKVVLSTEKQAEDKLMVLEGWVPDEKEKDLVAMLDLATVYYDTNKPVEEDNVPIKLKNNRFAKLYEPIGELYTMPFHKELDLTPFFAPFYMLFFGFCLGDAGYGLLITLGTIFGLAKASPKVKPFLKLGMFLGISTTIMGIIGGTFFGIMLHPENFEEGKTFAPWIMEYQKYILSSQNLMYVALGLGYIQVIFGMFLNAANKIKMYGFKYALSQLGWNIIVMITLPSLVFYMKDVVLEKDLSKNILIVSGIIGGIPALLYNSPGKNPLLNLGTGLWEAYGVASGLLGDVLSYIRLFALGLSSAILGNVFNQLAMDSSQGVGGVLGVLIMIIILAFGHSLNFFMAALGSFVHPLRLTFVEFYKNAGFMGGGKKYEPFSKKI